MNGKAHATASVAAAIPTGMIVAVILGPDVGLCATAGCLAGVFVTPDLDQLSVSRSEWNIIKRLPCIGWGWLALWDAYARIIPHRSIWSHLPILGTAGRLAYLEALDCAWWLLRGMPDPVPVTAAQMRYAAGVFIGLAVSDTMHWVMDGCPVRLSSRRHLALWPGRA